MDRQVLHIADIVLDWTEWFAWNEVKQDARRPGAVSVPARPGVYEARLTDEAERLTIGRSSHLRSRVKQGLLKGETVVGRKVRQNEDVSRILIRWALTDRPAAAEEELHCQHTDEFGRLPKHTCHT